MAIVTLESATPWYAHYKRCRNTRPTITRASLRQDITYHNDDHDHHHHNHLKHHHDQKDRPHLMVRSLSPTHTTADSSPQFVQICQKFLLLCCVDQTFFFTEASPPNLKYPKFFEGLVSPENGSGKRRVCRHYCHACDRIYLDLNKSLQQRSKYRWGTKSLWKRELVFCERHN